MGCHINEMEKKREKKRGFSYSKIKTSKKAAIEMSFQFIFSIILVGVVVFVAFFAIKKFLDQAEKIKLLDFVETIKSAAIPLWGTDGGTQKVGPTSINSGLSYVCFANVSRPCSFSREFTQPTEKAQICSLISSFKNKPNSNMFYYPASVATNYGLSPAQEVYCSEKGAPLKRCLDLSLVSCIPVKAGVIQFRLEKETESSLINIVPW